MKYEPLSAVGDVGDPRLHVDDGADVVAVHQRLDDVVLGRQHADRDAVDGAGHAVDDDVSVQLHQRRGGRATEPEPVALEGMWRAERRQHRRDPGHQHPRHLGVGRRHLVVVEPGGVDRRVAELVGRDQRPQEAGVGRQAEDHRLVERRDQRPPGGLAVGAVGDHLAEHRVVDGADAPARSQRGVDADAVADRPRDEAGHAGLGQEPAEGVLGIDPRLDGVARDGDVVLGERQRVARAMSSCRSTRSRPVTSSVTGCSTWSRVFISRK